MRNSSSLLIFPPKTTAYKGRYSGSIFRTDLIPDTGRFSRQFLRGSALADSYYLLQRLRLLPAGAMLAGRELYPLKITAFHGGHQVSLVHDGFPFSHPSSVVWFRNGTILRPVVRRFVGVVVASG